ncbi:MAG: hypothetical protein ACTIJ9_07215 [Aequorivita sp.]
MERAEEMVQEEMRALINQSCQFNEHPKEEFCDFHKDFLKFSFNAVSVEIDYDAQEIYTSNCKPLTTNPVRLFDLNKAVADQFSYSDLVETLQGCLDNDHLHYVFYKKLILEYGNLSKEKVAQLSV